MQANVFAESSCATKWRNLGSMSHSLQRYLRVKNICHDELKHKLNIITQKGHVALTYKMARIWLFHRLDNVNGMVCSFYSPADCKPYSEKRQGEGFNLNTEHTWPQSQGAKELPANSDLHHLFVTSKLTNSKRANLPFCKVESEFWSHGGSLQGIDMYSQDCFEPVDKSKGDVARALFYFSVRYDYEIESDVEVVLKQWHKKFPVTSANKIRNSQILDLQGNSNPFIEYPQLVGLIRDF